MGPTVQEYYEPTPINVTCWTETTMQDDKGIVQGDPLWLKEDNGCWINEMYVQGEDVDFTETLAYCSPPRHQVGFPKNSYYIAGSDGLAYVKCYSYPNTNSSSQLVGIGYLDLGCWTSGETVAGNRQVNA
jgi:hypothetical protein